MNIDVAAYFEQLLFKHESVIIPDFGGIVSSYRSASIDHVQGLLHPPSKSLSFNKNLIINDGILINHIAKDLQCPEEKVRKAIEQYVTETQATLEKREIVVFPGVGRLYKDYEGQLQFLQDSTNFNRDAYGLGSVQFYPILRNRETASNEAPIPVVDTPRPSESKESKLVHVLQSAMPLLAGLALVAFGLTFYLFETEAVHSDLPKTMPVAEKRINEKPGLEPNIHEAGTMSFIDRRNQEMEQLSQAEDSKLDGQVVEEEVEPIQEKELFETEIDTESITIGPDQKEGVIIIGTYNFKKSVQKMVNRIYELGYDVYQKKKPNSQSTRVGVQFVYEEEADLQRILKTVRKELDDRAWVLKQ
ncbi:MAG: hypothetical protein AAF985_02830 [Bacteroidota bacterium]